MVKIRLHCGRYGQYEETKTCSFSDSTSRLSQKAGQVSAASVATKKGLEIGIDSIEGAAPCLQRHGSPF